MSELKLKKVLEKLTEKISVEPRQLRVGQLDGELETTRDQIRQYEREEIF